MKIKTDVMGTKINLNQRIVSEKVQESMNRLSTGLRINSAKDDAAGLSVSTRLKAFSLSNNKGIENIKNGIDLYKTMDGGLSTIEDMLQRLRELTIQSKNGVLSESDRKSLQTEANQIIEAIDGVARNTIYNNVKGINSSLVNLDGVNDYVKLDESLDNILTSNHTIEASFSIEGLTGTEREVVFGFQGRHHGIQLFPDGRIGFQTWFKNTGALSIFTPHNFTKEGEFYDVSGVVDNDNREIRLYVNGKEVSRSAFPDGDTLEEYASFSGRGELKMGMGSNPDDPYGFPFEGNIKYGKIYSTALTDEEVKNNYYGYETRNGLVGEWNADDAAGTTMYNNLVGADGTLLNGASVINENVKIRTGSKIEDVLKVDLTNVSSNKLGIRDLNLTDINAIEKIDSALQRVLGEHSRIGSTINRMSFRLDQLNVSQQTNSQATSRITDANMAEESSIITKEQIKLQTTILMMQKNYRHRESAVSLLRG